jgi:hypothetical protein
LSFTVSNVVELQVVPTQTKLGARQSEFDAQEVLQAAPPQIYGEQLTAVGVTHVPVPLQSAGGVSVLPVQAAAAH